MMTMMMKRKEILISEKMVKTISMMMKAKSLLLNQLLQKDPSTENKSDLGSHVIT